MAFKCGSVWDVASSTHFRGSLEVKLKDRSELLPVSAAHAHLFKYA